MNTTTQKHDNTKTRKKMAKLERFEDLKCWKAARELVKLIYLAAEKGKLKPDWDTKSQIKRAALSVMNNIAEGFGRINPKDSMKFYDYAQSSCLEVNSILYVLEDLNYLEEEELKTIREQCDKTISLTLGFIRYLNNRDKK
jgi:four helix bundle protein